MVVLAALRLVGGLFEPPGHRRDVAQRLVESNALRRLAENPLMLTMHLVVKHGAGRLPPDRVIELGAPLEFCCTENPGTLAALSA